MHLLIKEHNHLWNSFAKNNKSDLNRIMPLETTINLQEIQRTEKHTNKHQGGHNQQVQTIILKDQRLNFFNKQITKGKKKQNEKIIV